MMLCTVPATGIAICQILMPINELQMSHIGYEQTRSRPKSTSAYPPTPDIPRPTLDFCL